MIALEKFYDSGDNGGEDVFNKFAAEHAHLFTKDSDAHEGENNLEWTAIHQQFCALFEGHIESKGPLVTSNFPLYCSYLEGAGCVS